MLAIWIFNGCMFALGLMLGTALALMWKLLKVLGRHCRELDQWRARMDEVRAMMERAKRDTGTVLDKIEDVTAQQVQDWNAVQQEIAVLDGRLGTVERRFGPLEEKPATLPDPEGIQLLERAHGPLSEYVPREEQEAKDGR